MDAITREKQYLLDARAYAATLSDLNLAVPADVSSFYTVTVTVSAGLPPLATLSAIPIAGKGQESDGTLSIATDGTKSPTDKRSEEHTSELQSLMRILYAVFCLKHTTLRERNRSPNNTNTTVSLEP